MMPHTVLSQLTCQIVACSVHSTRHLCRRQLEAKEQQAAEAVAALAAVDDRAKILVSRYDKALQRLADERAAVAAEVAARDAAQTEVLEAAEAAAVAGDAACAEQHALEQEVSHRRCVFHGLLRQRLLLLRKLQIQQAAAFQPCTCSVTF